VSTVRAQNQRRADQITDPARLADYRALTDVDLRTKFEAPHGLFIAEGELVLRRALRAGYEIRSVLIESKRLDQVADIDATVYAGGPDLMATVTGFHVHRGVLASFHRRPLPALADVLAPARRLAILADINNHTNIGAIYAARPRWAWMPSCCRRRARTRSTGAASGQHGRVFASRTPGWSRGRGPWTPYGRKDSPYWR
jgi:hypothetical protein